MATCFNINTNVCLNGLSLVSIITLLRNIAIVLLVLTFKRTFVWFKCNFDGSFQACFSLFARSHN
jgi:hypothetical protein